MLRLNDRFRPIADIATFDNVGAMANASSFAANGKCPACKMPVSFIRANFRRGKTYTCPACQWQLRTAKINVGFAMAAFALASYAGKEFGFLAVLVVMLALLVFEWLTVRVSLEEPSEVAAEAVS